MKKMILALGLVLMTAAVNAQEFKGINDLPMKTDEDYKMAEPTVKECADYLLSHSMSGDDGSMGNASAFVSKWMTGCSNYHFNIDMDAVKYAKKDPELLLVCMASMAKAALDNPTKAEDKKAMKLNSYKLFAEYCANPKYKVKQTSAIKKLIEANQKGELEKLLDWSFLNEKDVKK